MNFLSGQNGLNPNLNTGFAGGSGLPNGGGLDFGQMGGGFPSLNRLNGNSSCQMDPSSMTQDPQMLQQMQQLQQTQGMMLSMMMMLMQLMLGGQNPNALQAAAQGGTSPIGADSSGGSSGSSGASSGGSTGGTSDAGSASSGNSTSNAPGTQPTGNVKQWIAEAKVILQKEGIDVSKINDADLNLIIQKESGGNPHAQNNTDSNAKAGHPSKGLMQTIPTTFDANAAAGHKDIWNPVDNIVAGVKYAIKRYGSIANVPGVKAVHNGGSYVGY